MNNKEISDFNFTQSTAWMLYAKASRITNHLDRCERSWENDLCSNNMPLSWEIHPTNKCNLSCKFCSYRDKRTNSELNKEVFFELLSSIITNKSAKSVLFSGGGEPTQNNYLCEAIELLVANNIDVGLITNGVYKEELNDVISLCNWVRFSLNAPNYAYYKTLTNSSLSSYNKCKNNISNLKQRKDSSCTVGISMIVSTKTDIGILLDFIHLAKDLNVDLVRFNKDVTCRDWNNNDIIEYFTTHITQIEAYSNKYNISTNYTALIKALEANTPPITYSRCPIVWDNYISIVTSCGDVFPCLPIYSRANNLRQYSYGNINHQKIEYIMSAKNRMNVLKSFNTHYCANCRYDRMNAILLSNDNIIHYDNEETKNDKHINFL